MRLEIKAKTKFIITFGFATLAIILPFVFPEHSHALTIEPLHKVLQEVNNINSIWENVRDLVNSLVIAALIYVAFLNILRLQINNYAIKKFLPTLLLSVILANFSFFICKVFIDWANVALDLLMNGATSASSQVGSGIGVGGAFDFTKDTFKIDPNNLNRSFIYILAEFVGGVALLILAFLFFIRNYVIYFAVSIAPLAFMALSMTQTKKYFDQWWNQFLKWTFLPVVSVFWLWLGGMWYMSGFTGSAPAQSKDDLNSAFLSLAFAIVCYYMAITTPFKMGENIMKSWGNYGKLAPGYLNKQAGGISARTTFAGQNLKAKYKDVNSWQHKLGVRLENLGGLTNIQAMQKARKAGREGLYANLDKAAQKTTVYSALSGPEGRIAGARQKHEEDIKYMTANEAARRVSKMEDVITREALNPKNRGAKNFRIDLDKQLQLQGYRNGLSEAVVAAQNGDQEAAVAINQMIRKILVSEGPRKLNMSYKGIGDYFDDEAKAVMTEGTAINANQFLRNRQTRDEFEQVYTRAQNTLYPFQVPSPAVHRERFEEETMRTATEEQSAPQSQANSNSNPPTGTNAQAPRASATAPIPAPEVKKSAQETTEDVFREEHRRIAEALRNPGQSQKILQISADTIHAAAANANLSLSAEGSSRLATLATNALLDTKTQVTNKYNEKYKTATDNAIVNNGIMEVLSKSNRAKDTVAEMLSLTKQGKKSLENGDLESAITAAGLIDPRSSLHLEQMDKSGDKERLNQSLRQIFTSAETQLEGMNKKNGAVLAEEIAKYKQAGEGAWRQQFIDREMQGAAQDSHREVIIQERLQTLSPETRSFDEIKQVLQSGFSDLLASHRELSESFDQLPEEDKTTEIEKANKGLADTLDKTLRGTMPTMNDGDRLDVAKKKEAMDRALNNPQFILNLSKAFGKSMDSSLLATNAILKKSQNKGEVFHDVKPPQDNQSGTPSSSPSA